MIWAATYGSPNREVDGRNAGGSLFRLDPETEEVMQRSLGIEYSNPYNAEADPDDNIWVNPDNYLVKYDQKADTMTRYPAPTRTDFVRTRITRDGAVWTVYRNAGHYAGIKPLSHIIIELSGACFISVREVSKDTSNVCKFRLFTPIIFAPSFPARSSSFKS